jgi:Cys-tRNA(Pro) deacylase
MSRKDHASETPATTFLREHGVNFTEHLYDYVEHGGTAESSKQLGAPEHDVVKTLVMQDQDAKPLIILMHGDRQVSLKTLARQIGAKRVAPCKPDVAERHTGYQVWRHFTVWHAQTAIDFCGTLDTGAAFDLY